MEQKLPLWDKQNEIIQNKPSERLFISDFYEIKYWTYNLNISPEEAEPKNRCFESAFNENFSVVIVNRGNFFIDLYNSFYAAWSGYILVEKANHQYKFKPGTGECLVINFNNQFYMQLFEALNLKNSFFFSNDNMQLLVIKASAEIEYIYFRILKRIRQAGKLEMDNIVMELLNRIIAMITTNIVADEKMESLSVNHRTIVEKAKVYLNDNFSSDISLYEISRYCCSSAFHFARIFKKITSYTPHQYLLGIRLKHGEMMVKNTLLTISEISYLSGFSSVGYFATAFRQKYKMSPSAYRSCNSK